MNATRPEAETEYSRAQGASQPDSGGLAGPASGAGRTVANAVLLAGLAGSVALVIAEIAPLLHIRSGLRGATIASVTAGSHHSYALIPIAVLAAALSLTARRGRNPLALLAVGGLGLAALLIALLGDLPDAQATGVIGSHAPSLALAQASPALGFYLETLGAVVLLLTAGTGLLLTAPRRGPPAD